MEYQKRYQQKRIIFIACCFFIVISGLTIRLGYLMIVKSSYYHTLAQNLHQREREIKAERGNIYDRNGNILAGNKAVCTISVIHSQIKEPEVVIERLSKTLEIEEEVIRKKVEKKSSRERIKSNVDKKTADQIRKYGLKGVMVDEDYKRYYPYDTLASKVLGFTGSDNQGIIGLEVKYDKELSGVSGKILTLADAQGREVKNAGEERLEPVAGNNLRTSLDLNIQTYVEQVAEKTRKLRKAKQVAIIVMNPQNGEIYAMVNVPEFNLNEPYTLTSDFQSLDNGKNKQDLLNKMWRNFSVNDTYEPGSTFKIVTATAGLETGVVKETDTFSCPGFRIVEDRKIRCHKVGGHGQETFKEGIMNSCNPVFMDVGARVGTTNMYDQYEKLGLFDKTGIDVPGEAKSIMHKIKNVKAVELATMSFGQSFQITPLELLRASSAVVNGGTLITPHFGVEITSKEGTTVKKLDYPTKEGVITEQTSDLMKDFLEAVVSDGSGQNGKIEGFRIGGKTATSEKLPRRSGKYISSYLGFAPSNDPKVMTLVLIDEPEGAYYGGVIAAPVVKEIYENILPYLGIKQEFIEEKAKEK